ncbi:DUF485 domain-containing protein [Streptomyces sp. CA-249302]|uniref:DUF485 domain-containing protein n=1 Tax=Streptomyces sp. CA-249302 TaxID=3240058 RepID=UPI003D89C8A3
MNVEQAKRREISDNPEFRQLRRVQLRSGVRMTALAVGGFLVYVLLSSFMPALMNTSLAGHLTLGLALGLGQFVVMALVARRHLVHMRTRVDPIARGFRTQAHKQQTDQREQRARSAAPYQSGGYRTWR